MEGDIKLKIHSQLAYNSIPSNSVLSYMSRHVCLLLTASSAGIQLLAVLQQSTEFPSGFDTSITLVLPVSLKRILDFGRGSI
ncbi:unnamed protein product [Somion occarium]|uniref:Uncharacterized protein n=1 Tax=Somion occarium TaxID=3059160 RepID=A0ABP1CNT6_9APHY